MGIGAIALATSIGKVVVVGGVSILCNTLISYHHHYKASKTSTTSSRGSKRNEHRDPSERMQEIRKVYGIE